MCFLNNLKTIVFLAFLKMSVYIILLVDLIFHIPKTGFSGSGFRIMYAYIARHPSV